MTHDEYMDLEPGDRITWNGIPGYYRMTSTADDHIYISQVPNPVPWTEVEVQQP
jgi:hypothetical protein